eukprot:5567104-Prymnesium_polylepis.1
MTDHLLRFAGLGGGREASDTPATSDAASNRTAAASNSSVDDVRPMVLQDESFPAEAEAAPGHVRWKVGFEPPPFVSANAPAVELLKAIVNGTASYVPRVAVSKAVAVQVFRLIFVKDARSTIMDGVADHGLYVILASLAHGTRVEPADKKAVQRLKEKLARKSKPLGLALQFQHMTVERREDPELKSLSLLDARRALYMRWDRIDFGFDFGLPAAATTET